MRRHDDDAIGHVDGFVNVMGHQQHGRAAGLLEPQHFVLHLHAREGVERAERLVLKQDPQMIDERPRQGGALGHAAGKMVRIGVGKFFKAHQAHESFHFVALLLQQAARDKSRLNVPAGGAMAWMNGKMTSDKHLEESASLTP